MNDSSSIQGLDLMTSMFLGYLYAGCALSIKFVPNYLTVLFPIISYILTLMIIFSRKKGNAYFQILVWFFKKCLFIWYFRLNMVVPVSRWAKLGRHIIYYRYFCLVPGNFFWSNKQEMSAYKSLITVYFSLV